MERNTKELLDTLGVDKAAFVGHSLGGMLAVRFALMYPEEVSRLVLEDPIGFEDYRLHIPFKSVDEMYQFNLHTPQKKNAFVQALIYEMIYTQPVAYEITFLKMPTLLLWGENDRTVPGKEFASKDNQKKLGDFPVFMKNAATLIRHAKMHSFENTGHTPHLEVPQQFNSILLEFLNLQSVCGRLNFLL